MAVAEVRQKSAAHRLDSAMQALKASVQAVAACVGEADGEILGEALVQVREVGIDPLEAVFATGVHRFDKSGEYGPMAPSR